MAASRAGFDHLAFIYEESLRYEPGFVANPYDGMRRQYAIDKCYYETSVDQTILPGMGLCSYYELFTDSVVKDRFATYLAAQADW